MSDIVPSKLPTTAELAKLVREMRDLAGPVHDDAPCHYGIETREQCRRCALLDRAGEVLDRIEATHPEWLR